MLLAGKVIVSEVEEAVTMENGTEEKEKIKAFVQIDRETNSVVYTPTQIIGRNLRTITNEFDLPDDAIRGFWKGELVTIETTGDAEKPANITIGIDLLSDKGVVLVPGDATQWNKIVHKAMPEYTFGNDGCWINRHGMLSYVPEENFTQDILMALERQARQAGIPMEERTMNDFGHNLTNEEENDETRQMAR